MAVTSVSVILTVFVLKLHHCGPHQAEVPTWVRLLVLKYLARFVRCQCLPARKRTSKSRLHKDERQKGVRNSPSENAEICLRLVNEVNQLNRSPMFGSFRRQEPARTLDREDDSVEQLNPPPLSMSSIGAEFKRLALMEEILKYLRVIVAKRDDDDSENEVVSEWRQVAQVMDRVLFYLFLFVTGTATVVVLVFIPVFRA